MTSYLPETRDQLRIKGKAFILHKDGHLPSYLTNNKHLAGLLEQLYSEQSPARRASYIFGAPGTPFEKNEYHPDDIDDRHKEISDETWHAFQQNRNDAAVKHVKACLDRFALLLFEADSCDWTTCFGNPNTRHVFTLVHADEENDKAWTAHQVHA